MAIQLYNRPTTKQQVTQPNRKALNKQLSDTKTRLPALGSFDKEVPENLTRITTEKPRLSFLERLGAGLSAFETGNVAYKLKYGGESNKLKQGLATYGKDVFSSLAAATTGKREFLNTEKKYYKDIAEREGVKNSVAKFGIGFLADVFLDPSTYFGGTVIKAAGKGIKGATGLALKGADKIAPGVGAGAGAIKDAFGKAFVFGYGASPGVVETISTAVGKGERASKAVLASNFRRLGTGTLAKEQADSVADAIINLKRSEFAVGKGTQEAKMLTGVIKDTIQDKSVARIVGEQAKRSRKMATQHTPLESGDLFQYYFPTGDKTKIKNFVQGSRTMRIGSEDYLKKTAEVVAKENIQKDLPTAFGRVESEMVKNAIYKKSLKDIVASVGKPVDFFADADEAAHFGWKLLKSKSEKLGYVLENDYRVIQSLMNPGSEFATIDALAKATGFDAITNLFKRSVTGLFAPFYVRNFASGQIQAYEVAGRAALHPTAVGHAFNIAQSVTRGKPLTSSVELGAKTYKLKDIARAITDRFGSIQGIATEGVDNTIRAVPKFFSKESVKMTLKSGLLGQDSQVFRAARAANNFIEVQNKAQITIAGLMRGLDMDSALKLAEVGAFDYRHLTGFESKVLRRIVPFYAFTRKNFELQAKTLANNPARVMNIMKLIRDIGTGLTAKDTEGLPDYMRRAFNIKLGEDENGNPIITSSLGTPIEQVSQLISGNPILNGISQMNPLVKAPLEIGFGKDSFRQRDIKESYSADEYSSAPKILKDILLITEVEKPIYKNGKPTGKTKIQYVADPVRLLIARSLFTSRGFTYLDQIFDGDLYGFSKYLKLTTGVKPQVVEKETTEYFTTKAKEEAAKDILIRRGKIKSFESIYVPKKEQQGKKE